MVSGSQHWIMVVHSQQQQYEQRTKSNIDTTYLDQNSGLPVITSAAIVFVYFCIIY